MVNERLNAFVGSIGNIPPLRGAVQFPAVTVRAGMGDRMVQIRN